MQTYETPIDFGPDVARRNRLQPASARLHPGKLHLGFLEFLLTRYTKPGDLLLDPMAGCGSLIQATKRPYCCDVVLNELEAHWCEQIAASWDYIQAYRPVGAVAILNGDARTLSERLLREADVIVSSPPYGDALSSQRHGNDADREYSHGRAGNEGSKIAMRGGYDTVITSPPYADALGAQSRDFKPEKMDGAQRWGQNTSAQLRGMAGGYDAVVTSPPYADALGVGVVGKGLQQYLAGGDQQGPASLLRPEQRYDAVITSPPYADALSPQRHSDDYHPERQSGHWRGEAGDEHIRDLRRGYDPKAEGKRAANPDQIGNLSGKRYNDAMREIYAQCHKLLKPDGVMILVIKNVVRRNKEVDLITDAINTCVQLGFTHETTHWRKVRIGPFHAIRRKANPDALIIEREAAIVLRRAA